MTESSPNIAALKALEKALELCRDRLSKKNPQAPVLEAAKSQLEYVMGVASGTEPDRSRLNTIVLDIYSVREFDSSDPPLATALSDAMQYVKLLRSGSWSP